VANGPAVDQALSAVQSAFERRVAPGRALGGDAARIAAACRDMAARFQRGGRLFVFGNGGAATDAQHVAVEFVHPVVVGKRALPAICLSDDAAILSGMANAHGFEAVFDRQLRLLGGPDDIALGISADGRCANVLAGLRAARELGMCTVALTGGDGSVDADHVVTARSDDPSVVKEVHVTAYHVLWELVHVFFEQPGALECHDGICVTCSDTALPLRVREVIGDGLAVVDTDAGPEEISVALVDARPGDVVLVHAKEAIALLEGSS
jgi:D-sedoheptulose 7-phosphate isomerase